jgi:hypothetical protein
MMNQTVGNFSILPICDFCQTSYGFSSADQRSIIVLVVLTVIALILCYVGVLWYAIRTRFIPEDKLPIITENVYKNQAFDNNEDQDEDVESNVPTMIDTTTIQPAVLTVENERERF